MILKELELKKYTRLFIPGIKYLHYFPKQNMQIILASNGSGKSSLLKEIIPNVMDAKTEYEEDGYRIAKYLHNNKTYVLSYNRESNRHSFKVNDVEQNQSGLMKIQKILIEEHFHLNKDIHEMLLSSTTFTNMSVNERKRWFTDILTSIDYEYAMSKYNKVKNKIKDLTSYIKLIQSKIIFDDKVLEDMTETYIKTLKEDKKQFMDLLDDILNKRPMADKKTNLDVDNVLNIQNALYKLINKYKDVGNIKDADSILMSKELELIAINKEITELRNKLKDLKINGLNIDSNKQELTKELEDLTKKINTYTKDSQLGYEDYLIYIKELLSIHSKLLEIANELQNYEEIDITSERIKQLNDELISKQQELKNTDHTITILDRDLQKQIAYSESDDVTCPKCSNVFKPNHDEQKLNALKTELGKYLDIKEKLEKEIKILLEDIDKINNKRSLIANLKLLLTNDTLLPLYEELKDISDKFYHTYILSRRISDIYATLPEYETFKAKIDKLNDIKQKILILDSVTLDKLSYMQELKKELETKLSDALKKSNLIQDEIVKYTSMKNDKHRMVKYIKDLKTFISDIKHIKKEKYEVILKDYYNNLIYEIKHEIAEIDNKLVEHDKILSHRESLVKELNGYKEELTLAKKLESHLSPTKGIIGVSISTTINTVLERMNEIINSIWTYEINILPCDTDANDLTFRFPVKLNNNKTIPDVSKGSSAIREIIDLAFKITAMEFLDMLDYPLILDEFSSTMDGVHRAKSYEFIEELSRFKFKQIFLVSHYNAMYNRFNHTDVVVLDNTNVGYEKDHNEVIEIKH